jgi:hypothetical protein
MTPQPTTIADAHVLTAFQAACAFGREVYLNELRQFRSNVLFGWPSQKPLPKMQNNLHLNGGGMEQLKRDAVALALRECGGDKSKAAKKLKVNRSTIYKHIAALCLCVLAVQCFAQRGTVSTPTTTTLVTPLGLVSIPPFKQTLLVWDNPPGASNIVAWGTVRNYWTNGSRTIATNTFPVTNGWQYKVTALVNGVESTPALWPSNRIGELWLTGMGTNFTGGTNIQKLCSFTNQPPGQMRFWGVANITTGWE